MKPIRYVLLMIFLLAACQTRQALAPRPTSILTSVLSSVYLTSDNTGGIVELAALSRKSVDPVTALSFTADGQELLAFHSNEGILRHWRVRDGALLSTMVISPTGAATAFDGQGKYLAIAEGKLARATNIWDAIAFKGARLWDTNSGKMIFTTQPVSMSIGLPDIAVALDSDGKWLIEGGSGGIGGWDIVKGKADVSIANGGIIGEDPIFSLVTAVSTDAVGEWFVYATYKGEVTIERRDAFTLPEGRIWEAQIQDGGIPLALGFNAARTRLAAITTKSLVVWDLQALLQGTEVLRQSLPKTSLARLTFSPDGTLLVVSTDNGWQIWSVADGKLLLENTAPTYAVAFSLDGRLFAWGDTSGVVHIWGVPSR